MYTNPLNRQGSAPAIHDFLIKNSFATLVSQHEGRPWATHIPLHISEKPDGSWSLEGHVARANPSWKSFAENGEVLAIFTGPHAYVSSSWYEKTNVSTWNYLAVHVYGNLRVMEGDELLGALKKLTRHYETGRDGAIFVENMPPEYVKREMRGIVGFEILPTKIEGTWKLSQNRNDVDYQRIIAELEQTGEPQAAQIAEEMRQIRP